MPYANTPPARSLLAATLIAYFLVAVALFGWAHASISTLNWGPTPVRLLQWLVVNTSLAGAAVSAILATRLAQRHRSGRFLSLLALAGAVVLLVSFNVFTRPIALP